MGALDAYSEVVTAVAAELTPRVAALQVSRRTVDGRFAAGAGSAVVFTDDGLLLTNAHVVGPGPRSGLAVVRADGPTPPPAHLGEAADLRVGQLVVAGGNPLGLAGS